MSDTVQLSRDQMVAWLILEGYEPYKSRYWEGVCKANNLVGFIYTCKETMRHTGRNHHQLEIVDNILMPKVLESTWDKITLVDKIFEGLQNERT